LIKRHEKIIGGTEKKPFSCIFHFREVRVSKPAPKMKCTLSPARFDMAEHRRYDDEIESAEDIE
jgi:hypothetical protein